MISETHGVERARTQAYMRRRLYSMMKRVLDLFLCLALLPLALVIIPIIGLAIYVDSRGSVFFVQERVGMNGRRFRMYKFRTMKHDFDDHAGREFMKAYVNGQTHDHLSEGSVVFKPIHNQAQITRVGRILRQTSLDELPQIFNVMRGEMSLVGPRPNVPWEVEAYQEWHRERLAVRPGITGLAQVRGRSSISFDRIVRYDIEYIRSKSILLDIQILWWTLTSVFSGRGAG
jgi:lipopolysaccharide/colanic/teichoic acid biosynthesis glycosyltransferase